MEGKWRWRVRVVVGGGGGGSKKRRKMRTERERRETRRGRVRWVMVGLDFGLRSQAWWLLVGFLKVFL